MSGNKKRGECNDPDSIVHGHEHTHSLLCDHDAYFDEKRKKVVYLHGDEFHENCTEGHTHRSRLCLSHEFTKVARPGEDCSQRNDCHVHIRENGDAELHHPAEKKSKDKKCMVVAVLKPLT